MEFMKKAGSGDVTIAGKWLFRFVLIGIVAGFGAVIFHYLCSLGMHYFLDMMAGYRPDSPAGEHLLLPHTQTPFNRWVLLILPALGGLVSGWIVYTFAPEAEGHGTDAAIDAYHHKGGIVRGRIPIVKTIASTITLTTGGSGGREGPIAQIGAGFGSFLAGKLKLSERERRIMMAAGIGAGVGSIFRAPLAGALFAAEVLYRDPDFESEVLIPAGISSVVAYCIFCLVFGWGALFDSPALKFQNPLELGPYTVLSVILVLAAIFYIKIFYSVIGIFKKIQIPNFLKPAIGGLITGVIGFFLPNTLAFGYGYIQKAIIGELTITALMLLAVGKIFTTAFSIGSGGSGGVFGPSIVIGGALGGAVGKLFHLFIPAVVTQPASFVIVGMAGFFSAVSNAPISTIIFISEITNSYHLLLPSLLVCSLCYLLSRKWTIFHNQVKSRIDSPAHAGEFMMDILETIKVENLGHLVKEVLCVNEDMPFSEFKNKIFTHTKQHYFPVINRLGKFCGIFSSTDIREVIFTHHIEDLVVMKDIMVSDIISTTLSENLNTVLIKLTQKNIDALPVLHEEDSSHLIGLIYRRDIIAYYNHHIRKIKAQQ
ncbi:MAG: chloride channel protein [Desulfobacterales bacterium RIFOXYA12_FULL_46_15]|nr:MAG: chloride channel protein [Desulfobacula sp. GWF2_41_7]OGR27728.1 MAG: chloride channel protein [Desulfobacterales bacterium RIFOXYA12_FULL_46_15]